MVYKYHNRSHIFNGEASQGNKNSLDIDICKDNYTFKKVFNFKHLGEVLLLLMASVIWL